MLHRLPVELLAQILRSTLPPYSPLTYRKRQDELARLCLVNKRLSSVAQPMLYEVVEVENSGTLKRMLKAVNDVELGKNVKVLRLCEQDYDGVPDAEGEWSESLEEELFTLRPSDLRTLAKRCPNVVELRVQGMTLPMKPLEKFQNLRRLILSHVELDDSTTFRLSNLTELSLAWVSSKVPLPPLIALIQPSALPALSALHYELEPSPAYDFEEDEDPFPTQLSSFSFGDCRTGPRKWVATFTALPLPTLPTICLDDEAAEGRDNWLSNLRHAQNLRLQPYKRSPDEDLNKWIDDSSEMLAEQVSEVAAAVSSKKLEKLRTLYVPTILLAESATENPFNTAMSSLLAACEIRDIEIVSESPVLEETDSLISPKFVRRCKAEKEEKEGDKA